MSQHSTTRQEESIRPAAWTITGPDGKSSIGGWQEMGTYAAATAIDNISPGHTLQFAITRNDHVRSVSRIRNSEVAPLTTRNAELESENARLRKVLSEVTDCLSDTYHERGGWAVEEVISSGKQAAAGGEIA